MFIVSIVKASTRAIALTDITLASTSTATSIATTCSFITAIIVFVNGARRRAYWWSWCVRVNLTRA
uniref:Candidate secreted effector n=1 Tax=Meloidogyne incognita TaxID=6306 RepID=A0A914KQ60_MELIC